MDLEEFLIVEELDEGGSASLLTLVIAVMRGLSLSRRRIVCRSVCSEGPWLYYVRGDGLPSLETQFKPDWSPLIPHSVLLDHTEGHTFKYSAVSQ